MSNTLHSLLLASLLSVPVSIGSTLSLAADQAQAAAPTDAPQGHKSGAARKSPEQHTARMKKDLNLSDEQTARVLDTNRRFDESMKKMHDEHRAQMDALAAEHNREMRAVLDDAQYQKYLDRQQRRAAKRRQRMPPPPGE